MPAARSLAATAYRDAPDAAGLALRDLLDQTVAAMLAELEAAPGEPDRMGEERAALLVLAAGGSVRDAVRQLGYAAHSAGTERLYTLRGQLLRRLLERATAP